MRLRTITTPSDEIGYNNLSSAQRQAYDAVRENRELYNNYGFVKVQGVLIIGSWGSGKSQVLRTMKRDGLLSEILERGQIYEWITRDPNLESKKTRTAILRSIIEIAKKTGDPFIALDNPDIPTGSDVSENGAYEFTWYLLEQATFGILPFIVVTLNDFTFRKYEKEKPRSTAKLAQHFTIVRLEWSSEELARAIEERITINETANGGLRGKTQHDLELIKSVAELTRTPRSGILLYLKALQKGFTNINTLQDLIIDEGIVPAFNTYIELLSRSGYKLARAPGKKWIEVWRSALTNKSPKVRGVVRKLIDKERGALSKELNELLGKEYKVAHWPRTAAENYHIIERPEPLKYRFTDEFMAAAVDYAAGQRWAGDEVLKNMAELYGRVHIIS